jgi:predicted GTPase
MTFRKRLRHYWPEVLLVVSVVLPWLSLLGLGLLWLWQGHHVWAWAIAAALVGLPAIPLARLIRRRANAEVRLALSDVAEPRRDWNVVEREAWSNVLSIADATAPLSFTETEPLIAGARETVEAVARRFHPEADSAWARFSLPEILLLAERLCRDTRREALRHVPGIRSLRLSDLLWVQRQSERYGTAAQTGLRLGYGLWRIIRAALNPLQAVGSETSNLLTEKAASVLSYRVRAYATRLLVLEVGRAAIDLYSGRLVLSDDELRAAQALDSAVDAPPVAPVRIILIGQVNAGKSSLLNGLAREIRSAVGPVPTTARATEYRIDLEGRPAVSIVDMPGLAERDEPELLAQVARADLILWVASATQPARDLDRHNLETIRAWASGELARRAPPILLALSHIDELRPAIEWAPPYDIAAPSGTKAQNIRAAVDAVTRALGMRVDVVVPVAMPPELEFYNLDALWARIAVELDEAKLVQLDRLRLGRQRLSLRELADQLGHAGRFIIKGAAKAWD